MSADSQLNNAAIAHEAQAEQLLDFVVWLFDDANRNGVGTLEDHRNLIRAYLKETA